VEILVNASFMFPAKVVRNAIIKEQVKGVELMDLQDLLNIYAGTQ
jgi:hypothetical protein